jgi:hypothetical protein
MMIPMFRNFLYVIILKTRHSLNIKLLIWSVFTFYRPADDLAPSDEDLILRPGDLVLSESYFILPSKTLVAASKIYSVPSKTLI